MEISLRSLTKMLSVNRITFYKWLRPNGDDRPRTSIERLIDVWQELLPRIPNSILALGFAQVANGVVLLTAEVYQRLSQSGHLDRLCTLFPGLKVYAYPEPPSPFEGEANAERSADSEV